MTGYDKYLKYLNAIEKNTKIIFKKNHTCKHYNKKNISPNPKDNYIIINRKELKINNSNNH